MQDVTIYVMALVAIAMGIALWYINRKSDRIIREMNSLCGHVEGIRATNDVAGTKESRHHAKTIKRHRREIRWLRRELKQCDRLWIITSACGTGAICAVLLWGMWTA
ncbi:hypothetical protein IJG29_03900 [Candidatus Saccharibacteria bacterium]|nr:hypothetical protein [Candidatus Saccharibacteria bacterium]